MILSEATRLRLLSAIEGDTLVFLCGAGLSIPAPSNLLSAKNVAAKCYDKWFPIEALSATLRDDIDLLAAHFHAARASWDVFIRRLIPWNDLVGFPNNGHAAIADLLVSRAAYAALSANFDTLIEQWAAQYKCDYQCSLTGQDAVEGATVHSPLLKFHGCMTRTRSSTLWTHPQLEDPEIKPRIESCTQWIHLHLAAKHLVVVGFWSDWGYLNDALAAAFDTAGPSSVTVIDPDSTVALEAKAPLLWAKLTTSSAQFEHISASGTDALSELRTEYSRAWARKFYSLGAALLHAEGGSATVSNPFDTVGLDALYDLRRDAEGKPHSRAAQWKAPQESSAQAATAYALFLNKGALQDGSLLRWNGKTYRIVNGGGRGVAEMREQYGESPSIVPPDVIVCAGAFELNVPARVIASGSGASVVRPASGSGSMWCTLEQARAELAA
jgi:hypothetical protein